MKSKENVFNSIDNEATDLEMICPITNQYAFPYVMGDGHEDNCRDLLQRIFPDKEILDMKLVDLSGEKTILNYDESKFVRLDVLFRGESEWFDIEMQVRNSGDLRKRSRFYHSSMDVLDLEHGHEYNELKPHYVIFICTFDMFGKGEAIYTFEHFDRKNDLSFNDGYYTIVLNLKCKEGRIPEELRTFYRYANEQKVAAEDDFIKRLHSDLVKFSRENGGADMSMQGFMTVERDMEINIRCARREGVEAGIELGRSEGLELGRSEGEMNKAKSIAKAMKEKGMDDNLVIELTGLSIEAVRDL